VRHFSTQDDYAWERARQHAQFLHNEAAKSGQCQLVSDWRKEIQRAHSKPSTTPAIQPSGGRLDGRDKWICSRCTFENPLSSLSCMMCQEQQTTESTALPSVPDERKTESKTPVAETKETSPSSDTSGATEDPTKWQCSSCTYQNDFARNVCEMCESRNPNAPPVPSTSAPPDDIPYGDPYSNDPQERAPLPQSSPEALLEPDFFPAPPPVDTRTWQCDKCTFFHDTFTSRCQACNSPNPQYVLERTSGTMRGPGRSFDAGPNQETPPRPTGFFDMFSSPPQPNWICPGCTTENNAQVAWCKSCKLPNQQKLVQAQGGENCIIS